MKAEILSIGTELLLGDTINTNAARIGQQLAKIGINCYFQTVVGDNPRRMEDTLKLALSRSDIVITTGGLGPTYDDVTKETVAEHFGLEMELHQPSYDMLVNYFASTGREMTENNKKQAVMPRGAVIFENQRGTANGLAVEAEGKIVVMLPGPPRELNYMFDNQVVPYLEKFSTTTLVSHTIHFFGIGEAQLEQGLRDYMLQHENPTIAPYAGQGEVMLRVTASASSVSAANALIRPVVSELCEMYPKYVYGVDATSLQHQLVKELAKQGKTIATAESCTGGLVSKRITDVDGSSEVFGLGVCSYSNQMKMKVLNVNSETLEKHGAVSPQTALEMAEGVRLLSGADYGISTTGVAGPTGGTKEKPVGLVYIGISGKDKSEVIELNLKRGPFSDREHVRYMASSNALHLALKTIRPNFTYTY